ncbi:uncharacterized protein LAESUDRAFT_71674 [Laetiporus sulphureus 93-53]|uniref:Uncharacterized protein n=1 Tax=Laetiporus sulphureus 93-53 TaxID=1314785 RepID=A0A165AW63_9APHY|nr:uncharacterized protein LAESUDRAFT_71674 [Laetiporus sulphureus 93-53]KZS99773.1 hypothetical protein LAESUDRAFT_71674 [Laetiporus sulphureus 93-53]
MEIYSMQTADQEKDKSLDANGRSHTRVIAHTDIKSGPRPLTPTHISDHFTRPSRHMERYHIGHSGDGTYRDLGYHALRLATTFQTYHEEASHALRLTGSMIAPINERVVVTHRPPDSVLSDAATAYSTSMIFGQSTVTHERDVIAGCHGACGLCIPPTAPQHQLHSLSRASTSVKQNATTENALVLRGAVLGASDSHDLLVDENDCMPLSQNSLRCSPHMPINEYPQWSPPPLVEMCHSIDTVSSCTQNGTEYSRWTPPSIFVEDDGRDTTVDISSERLWEVPSSMKYILENGLRRRNVVDAGASDSSKRLRARSPRQSTQLPGWDLPVRTRLHDYAISSIHTMQRHSQSLRNKVTQMPSNTLQAFLRQHSPYTELIPNTLVVKSRQCPRSTRLRAP